MSLKTVEQEWNHFADHCFAKDVSYLQRTEMKKAFFAGAFVVVCMCEEIGQPHISEQDGADHLDAVMNECRNFYKDLLKKHGERN
jgi:hypothetical protein